MAAGDRDHGAGHGGRAGRPWRGRPPRIWHRQVYPLFRAFCQNLIRFLVAREKLYHEPDAAGREPLLAEMRRVAEAEISNTREALPLCVADSRIGYATAWGDMRVAGFFTPALLRWKIAQVEQMIREEMPRFDPAWTQRLSGFRHVASSRADRALLPSYREEQAWVDICYQHKPGSLISWETAPVPRDVPAEGVAFAFAGGLATSRQRPTKASRWISTEGKPFGSTLHRLMRGRARTNA